jgi:Protein of unknown function (DUF2971)
VKNRKQKRRRHTGGKRRGAALNPKAAAAVDGFQKACNRRMAEANAAGAPMEPLFHYTKEAALFGILDSNQFYFTSIYHMDDPEELNFGFTLARDLFQEAAEQSTGLARSFCRELGEVGELEKIRERITLYSASFGLRDIGQQWIDYAGQGRGVALGFANEFFQPVPFEDPENPKPEEMIYYAKVAYGHGDGGARHQKAVNDALAVIEQITRRRWLRSGEEAAEFCRRLASAMYTEILWNCVTTKDDTWKHQNETRLLLLDSLKTPRLAVVKAERPRVELVQPRLRSSLVEVMVGPRADTDAVKRVREGLAARGLKDIPVTQAKPEFRTVFRRLQV